MFLIHHYYVCQVQHAAANWEMGQINFSCMPVCLFVSSFPISCVFPVCSVCLAANAGNCSNAGHARNADLKGGELRRQKAKYSNEILTHYARGYHLFSVVVVVPLLISPPKVKFTP